MIETIILAFVMAKIHKYKLLPIFKSWSIYPIVFMTILYICLESMIWQGEYSLVKYSYVFKSAYIFCFFILAVHYNNMKIFFLSIPFVWIGSILNTIAIKANFGKMPVFFSNSWATGYAKPDMFLKALEYGDIHIMGDMYTKFIPLCDTWDFGWFVASPGDIMIRSFAFLIIYHSIKKSNQIHNIISIK
jgi:hypothetical protein